MTLVHKNHLRNSYFYSQERRKYSNVCTMKLFKSLVLIISVKTLFSLFPVVLFSSSPGTVAVLLCSIGDPGGILPSWMGSCIFLALQDLEDY